MKTWTNPIINALKSSEAIALQQIFSSLSQELGRMSEQIDELRIEVNKKGVQQYQRIK